MRNKLLRRLPVRVRILAMVVLLAAVMTLPIPLGVIGQNRLLGDQQQITQALVDTDRLLLMASARITSSQINVLRFLQGAVPTPEGALTDINEAIVHLDAAHAILTTATTPRSEQAAQVQDLLVDLVGYQALLGQAQALGTVGTAGDAAGLQFQLLEAGDALVRRIDAVAGSSQAILDAANREMRQTARRSLVLVVGLELIMVAGVLIIVLFTSRSITGPIEILRDAAERLGQGDLDVVISDSGRDEFSFLAEAFNGMTARLVASYRELEQRVADRTSDLEERAEYMRAVIDVSRATTDIRDPRILVPQSVEVIRQRFDLYYVGLFLVDQSRRTIVLQAGTGEAGQAMLAHGHQLAFGQGMIGWCVANARLRVSQEAAEDVVRVISPYLPDTRSEAAIPLRSQGRVIGALTVQDDQPGAFDREVLDLLQVMADLMAVAIENARLLNEVQTSLDIAQRAYGQMTREGWLRILQGRTRGYAVRRSGALESEDGDAPSEDAWVEEVLEAWRSGDPEAMVSIVQDGRALSVPITARGIPVGAVRLTKAGATWTTGEVALVQTVVEQLGLALDSARLYEYTQIRAARDRAAREISDHMRATVDWDDLMETAVQEIGQAVQASRVFVQWLPPDAALDIVPGIGRMDEQPDDASSGVVDNQGEAEML